MQKVIFKISLAGISLVAAPLMVLAINQGGGSGNISDNKPLAGTNAQDRYCERVTQLADQYDSRVSNKVETAQNRWNERYQKMTENRQEREATLKEDRAKRDANREQFYSKLGDKALTDDQKQALADFQLAIENAVKIRRSAVDASVDSFRSQVDSLVIARKTEREQAMNEFQTEMKAAFASAESACNSGTDVVTVRSDLKTNLQGAKTKLQSRVQSMERLGEQVSSLASQKKTEIQNAVTIFKASVKTAQDNLAKALGETADTSTESAQ
jgi:hypothetical protein